MMNPYRRALIDYWLEIGKLRRERRHPDEPTSPYRYFFVRPDGIELRFTGTWNDFFRSFNYYNEILFVNAELLDLTYNLHYRYFDPWTDPTFITASYNFDELVGRGGQQTYRGVVQLA